jgi:hypothetical protein
VLIAPETAERGAPGLVALGIAIVAAGEAIRLWGVRHIGAVSRTRSERLGPLIVSGPFALMRNPLYVGNIALWIGFALSARLPWLVPAFAAILMFEYHAIVRWEERLLDERLGERYRRYAAYVPRWIPALDRPVDHAPVDSTSSAGSSLTVFPWTATFFSERGTLLAIAIGFGLLWLKARGFWLDLV